MDEGRKFAMFICASTALCVVFVPHVHHVYPNNVWFVVVLLSLAVAAHQGWSCNLLSTPSDMFPSSTVSTVVGAGAAFGSLGGVIFTQFTKIVWNSHPFLIFLTGGLAYLGAFAIFCLLVPQLTNSKSITNGSMTNNAEA